MTSVMTECIIKIYSMSRIIQPSLLSLIVNLAENKNPHSKSEGLCFVAVDKILSKEMVG